MKKFVFYFIFYIGFLAAVFNPVFSFAAEEGAPVSENTAASLKKKRSISRKITNDFVTFIAVPFVVDKLYPESEINADITPVLKRFYPNTAPETLETLGRFIKLFVSFKRRYEYVVTTLEQKVKAAGLVPTDAPIVAEDGEYAPAYSDVRKQTPNGTYQVGYEPYKYLEYDSGELGEPVRRRDKNYAGRTTNEDEIVLALLKFDIPAFVKALRKLPRQTDGSDEATVINEHGVASRILLGVSAPGENEKIRGVIQLNIPQGYYINADFLNPRVRPQFILSEDKDNELNIKEYQLFLPEANGIVKDGIAKRILTGTVRYPIEFTRADIEKPMKIKGTFGFEMCHKDGGCRLVTDKHELTLNPSLDEELSIFNNYVTQGFTHLPPEQADHATLKSAEYNENTGELTLTFATSRPFSNVAAMVEDAEGTSYLNPHYTIANNEITATFTASPSMHTPSPHRSPIVTHGAANHCEETSPLSSHCEERSDAAISSGQTTPRLIAVTAGFDNIENLRTTITPTAILPLPNELSSSVPLPRGERTDEGEKLPAVKSLPWISALFFGLFLPLCPGIFYLFVRLVHLLWTRPDRRRILFRYGTGSALGLSLLAALFHGSYWSRMYENAPLIVCAGLVVVSMLAECTGQMDFALFRPLRGKLRRGFLIGFFSILLLTAFPMPFAAPVFSVAFAVSADESLKILFLVWLGMQLLPLAALLCRPNAPYFLPAMQRLNIIYNLLYLFGALCLIGATRGETAVWVLLALFTLVYGFWHIYPEAVAETIKHTKSPTRQQQLFYKVQRVAAGFLLGMATLAAAGSALFPKEPEPPAAPTPAEIAARFRQNAAKPVLVTVTTNWSPLTPVNSAAVKRLPKENAEVMAVPASGNARAALPWLNAYNSLYAPLNVLFTSRHPNGLKLPANLNNIDWQTALETFDSPKEERTTKND